MAYANRDGCPLHPSVTSYILLEFFPYPNTIYRPPAIAVTVRGYFGNSNPHFNTIFRRPGIASALYKPLSRFPQAMASILNSNLPFSATWRRCIAFPQSPYPPLHSMASFLSFRQASGISVALYIPPRPFVASQSSLFYFPLVFSISRTWPKL
jgi:hypothetical protein